jgi:hypothetical protein
MTTPKYGQEVLEGFTVTKEGRIYKAESEKPFATPKNHSISLTINGKRRSFNMGKIMAYTFMNGYDEKKFINFKNGNRQDFRLENLEIDEVNQALEKKKIKIIKTDLNGNIIGLPFDSMRKASKNPDVNVQWADFHKQINKCRPINGFFYYKQNLGFNPNNTRTRNIKTKSVLQINPNTNEIVKEFVSITKASEKAKDLDKELLNISISQISNSMLTGKLSCGFFWQYNGERITTVTSKHNIYVKNIDDIDDGYETCEDEVIEPDQEIFNDNSPTLINDIEWFPIFIDGEKIDKYLISKCGQVWSPMCKRPLIQSVSQGYSRVCLSKYKHQKIHRLMAYTFLGLKGESLIVNHKNGIKTDNSLENLEVTTQQANVQHSRDELGNITGMCKRVLQYSPEGEFVNVHKSIADAANFCIPKVDKNTLQSFLKNRNNGQEYYGFIWKYETDVIVVKPTCRFTTMDEFPDYEFYEDGSIWTNKRNHILKPQLDPDGYQSIKLSVTGSTTYKVHILIAKAFLENPDNKKQVNHIDKNRSNNHVENLEWCTSSENMKHSFKNGHKSQKPVLKLLENGETEWFPSGAEASRSLGANPRAVSKAISNNQKVGGFYWKYE